MTSKLKKTFLITSAAMGVMLALGNGKTWAADMCFKDDYNSVLVGKKFKFPRFGDCTAFNGYELGTNCILTGTACGTSNNADIRFNINSSCPSATPYFGNTSFAISRLYSNINQGGFGISCSPNLFNGGWYCTNFHVNTIPCPTSHPLS